MRRREFIAGLGAAAWPVAARAQQDDRVRHIGVLMGFDENDPDPREWLSGFIPKLAGLGWNNGPRVRIDVRWAAGHIDLSHL